MTNLDSILKSRNIALPTKVRLVKALVFPVVVYGCESWTLKKAEQRRVDAFELWCWWTLESPLDCKEVHPVHLKRNQTWIFPSIRVFSNESVLCIRWPKDWSFSLSISASNVYSGLIPFRIDWLGLLSVQGTRKSLLQHHNSKASVLRCSVSLWSNSHIHT